MAESTIRIRFNGQELAVRPGISVAAALIDNGITAWRSTRAQRRPRGAFCGIGVCFDCLVSIDDHPGRRACLVSVCDGMEVTAHDDHI